MIENERLVGTYGDMELYYSCCGKTICGGCSHDSFRVSGNMKCPFCNSDRRSKTDEEMVEDIMKRVEVNDAASISLLGGYYYQGVGGLQQDHTKALELLTKSADLGYKKAHQHLADIYYEGGNLKKAEFHYEAAAMAGNEVARNNLGFLEYNSGNKERALKHWTIAASAGHYNAMQELRKLFEKGAVGRESIDSALTAYNDSCAEMRSEARDTYIRNVTETI
jgi:TPR repeat protein